MHINMNPLSWFGNSKSEINELKQKLEKIESEFGFEILKQSHAGINVSQTNAIESEIVYTCIRDKAESIGQLPVIVKRNNEVLKKGNREHKIFAVRPNSFQTTQDFIEMYVTCLELYGNFYALVVRNVYGNIAEIIPFRNQMNVNTATDTFGRVYHTYVTNDGKPGMVFSGGDVIHIKLNSLGGVVGLSPITAAARTIGVATSQEQHLAKLMEKGSMPSGVLQTDQIFKDQNALNRLKDRWQESYGGSKNTGKTPLLEGGIKYQALSLSPVDSDLIKQRVFSRIQLAGIFRVPLSRLGVVEAQRYNSVEENNWSYLRDALIPLIVKFESAINYLLPDNMSITIDVRQYVRGDRKSQVESIGSEVKLGLISLGEGREDLGRPRKEGDEVHAIDTNNLTFGVLTDIPKLQEQARLQAAAKPKVEVPKDE